MKKISGFFLLMCIKTVLVSTFDPWLNTYGYLEVSKDWNNNYMKNIQCESKNFENTATVRLCSQLCWSQTRDNLTNKVCVSAMYDEFSQQCRTCVGYGCEVSGVNLTTWMDHVPSGWDANTNVKVYERKINAKAPDVYMALDVIPTDGIYPGTNLTWSVVAGDSSPTISSSAEGKFGKAIYFNGSRQRVDLGSGPRCIFDTELCDNGLTVAFWIKLGTKTSPEALEYFGTGSRSGDRRGFNVHQLTSGDIFVSFKTTNHKYSSKFPIQHEVWYHFMFVGGKGKGLTVYLDGCKQVSLDAELGTFPQKRNLALAWPSTYDTDVNRIGEFWVQHVSMWESAVGADPAFSWLQAHREY